MEIMTIMMILMTFTLPRLACMTVKTVAKKAPQLWAKTSPGSSMGVAHLSRNWPLSTGEILALFGAKLPPRATHCNEEMRRG